MNAITQKTPVVLAIAMIVTVGSVQSQQSTKGNKVSCSAIRAYKLR